MTKSSVQEIFDDPVEAEAPRLAELQALCLKLRRENARLRREARARSEERLTIQTLIDWVPDILWVKDVDSRFVIANQAAAAKIGLGDSEALLGKNDFELHPMETARQYYDDEQVVLRSGTPLIEKEEYVIDAFGRKTWILTTKVPLRDDAGAICGLVGISHDITERRRGDLLRQGYSEVFEMIATSADISAALGHLLRIVEDQMTGVSGAILLSDRHNGLLRLAAAPSLSREFKDALETIDASPVVSPFGAAIDSGQIVIIDDIGAGLRWPMCRAMASRSGYLSCWSIPILSHGGAALGVFVFHSPEARGPSAPELQLVDSAARLAGIAVERKLAEDRIRSLANHDVLTGLPNRALLEDRLAQAMRQADRNDRWATLLFVDLDDFKGVNDSFGHSVGDGLLKAVGDRMAKSVRATDSVIRIGGDEFIVVLTDQPRDKATILAIVEKLQAVVAKPVCIAGHDLSISLSIGAAIYPQDGAAVEDLLFNADAAMYLAKQAGPGNFQFYSAEAQVKGKRAAAVNP